MYFLVKKNPFNNNKKKKPTKSKNKTMTMSSTRLSGVDLWIIINTDI